jgi:hypothetical protein
MFDDYGKIIATSEMNYSWSNNFRVKNFPKTLTEKRMLAMIFKTYKGLKTCLAKKNLASSTSRLTSKGSVDYF